MSEFNNKYSQLREIFDRALYREFTLVEHPTGSVSELDRAMEYATLAGGKHFRPVMALAAAESLEIPIRSALSFAVALETIHTATLIHDDLPALDNDSLRRGKPTLHVAFNEAIAVLSADALTARAFSVVAKDSGLPAEARLKMLHLLAETLEVVCQGQVLDLTRESTDLPEKLLKTHRQKTAALIRASVVGPSFLLGEERQEAVVEAYSSYGEALGLLFQITDDLLDCLGNSELTGKNSGNDARQGTQTFVSVFGENLAREAAARYAAEAKSAVAQFGKAAWFLEAAVDFVQNRER